MEIPVYPILPVQTFLYCTYGTNDSVEHGVQEFHCRLQLLFFLGLLSHTAQCVLLEILEFPYPCPQIPYLICVTPSLRMAPINLRCLSLRHCVASDLNHSCLKRQYIVDAFRRHLPLFADVSFCPNTILAIAETSLQKLSPL